MNIATWNCYVQTCNKMGTGKSSYPKLTLEPGGYQLDQISQTHNNPFLSFFHILILKPEIFIDIVSKTTDYEICHLICKLKMCIPTFKYYTLIEIVVCWS